MTRLRAVVRGVVSFAALAALIGGVPWALTRWGQLPGTPSGAWWERLSDTVVSDQTVFTVLTIAAWAVWAIFTTSVLVEVVAGLRGVQAPRLGFAGPLQRGARALVVGVLMTVSLSQHTPALAAIHTPTPTRLPLPDAAVTVVVELPTAAPANPTGNTTGGVDGAAPLAAPATAAEAPPGGVITVELHDSPWKLAEVHLHDGLRWRELWELNRNVPQPDGRAWTDPQLILPGWRLQLPPAEPTAQHPPEALPAGPIVHVVARGDTLSAIAEEALGDPDRYPEIFTANRDIVQPDGRHLTDPNLIVPGWQLTIPTAPPPAAAPPTPDIETSPAPQDTPTPPTTDEPAAGPSTPEPAPTTTTTDASTTPVPVTSTPPTSTAPPRPTSPTVTHPEEPAADPDADRSAVPIMAGISGAVALATGIALRMRWLRRRRATRGAGHGNLPPTPVELAALTAADVPLVRWAGQHLARLVRDVDRRRVTAGPVAVELSTEAGIEVLWDAPQHAPTPAGWTAADGGWAWRLGYDPDDAVPADELPAGIPALVTVGQRDGRQLLVDLEAFGLVTVAGPDEHTDAFVRSVTVELVCGNDLSDAYITTVDVDVGLDPQDRLTATDAATATVQLRGTQRSISDVLEQAGTKGTFTARTSDTTPIEATVIVAHVDDAQLTRLREIAVARHGVAVVAVADGAPPSGCAHIQIDPSGTSARLEPLGLTFEPVGLPAPTGEALHTALAVLAELPDDPVTETDDTSIGAAGSNGHRPAAPEHPPAGFVERIADPPLHTAGNAATVNGALTNRAQHPHDEEDRAEPDADVLPTAATLEPATPPDGRLFDLRPRPVDDTARLLVRVLGVPAIPARPSIGRRELILATLLACRGGTLAASAAQDALWGGKPLEVKTAWNLYASTRRALGSFDDGTPVMPSTDRARGLLRLDPRVTTDLAVLRGLLDQTRQASSVEAAALLQEGLGLVEGPPFDAPGYDWAHRDQDVSSASTVIEQAVDHLVALALDADQLDVAREAIIRGLRGLPGDEHLYRRRMRVEAHAGNHAGIVAAYDELTVYLADFETRPSTATTALYHELIHAPRPSPGLR